MTTTALVDRGQHVVEADWTLKEGGQIRVRWTRDGHCHGDGWPVHGDHRVNRGRGRRAHRAYPISGHDAVARRCMLFTSSSHLYVFTWNSKEKIS